MFSEHAFFTNNHSNAFFSQPCTFVSVGSCPGLRTTTGVMLFWYKSSDWVNWGLFPNSINKSYIEMLLNMTFFSSKQKCAPSVTAENKTDVGEVVWIFF